MQMFDARLAGNAGLVHGITREIPPWAMSKKPNPREMRRGILYVGLEPEPMEFFLREIQKSKNSRPVTALAGIGPMLWLGREDSPFIPWDFEASDENRGCKVRDRPWPYCWGDVVWAIGIWDAQPLYFRWALGDMGQMYLGSPMNPADRQHEVAGWLADVARAEAGEHVTILRSDFWRMDLPTAL